jgi:hypothetical protein
VRARRTRDPNHDADEPKSTCPPHPRRPAHLPAGNHGRRLGDRCCSSLSRERHGIRVSHRLKGR